MADPGRDRIRELLDAVLDDDHHTLDDMASGAHASPFHFSRQFSRHLGEAPVALRRRVLLERAAWMLQRGESVTDTAFESGYESVEGFARAFARAFGHPPSHLGTRSERGHWLPAPNGIHFHSPTVLYVDSVPAAESSEESTGDIVSLMVRHDLEDVSALLEAAKGIGAEELRAVRMAGHSPLAWNGPEETLEQVYRHLVLDKVPWLASIAGDDEPDLDVTGDIADLIELHGDIAPRWLALTRDIDRRGAWSDRIVDAICDPPESFVLSQIWAHVLTFSAHRRQIARWMLAQTGIITDVGDPDPIMWHRRRSGGF